MATRWSLPIGASIAALGLIGGCESTPAEPPVVVLSADAGAGQDPVDAADPDAQSLESRCVEAAAWAPGTPVFREATAEWGLHDLKVEGVLVHVTELDGDGWPDLIINHEGGNDVFAPEPSRVTWVLRNREGQGFDDVTKSSGLRRRRVDDGVSIGRPGQMIAVADVDNDGDLDVFTGGRFEAADPNGDSSELMLNDGDGRFTFGPELSDARRAGRRDFANSLSFTDYDRDGFIDLWVVNNVPIAELWRSDDQQDRLYAGQGDGVLLDVTEAAGLKTHQALDLSILNDARGHSWGWAATVCDLNDDGNPELLAASYGRTPNNLWQAAVDDNGDVRYLNQSIASGYAFDDNHEWWLDLNARCYCLENPMADECDRTEPPAMALCESWKAALGGYRWQHEVGRQPFMTGGVSASTECADINNDGHLDLLTGEIVHPDVGPAADRAALLVNTGAPDVVFDRRAAESVGLGRPFLDQGRDEGVMNSTVLDFDNDGWVDVYWSSSAYPINEGLLYHQDAPLQFSQVEFEDAFRHYHSHGVQPVDLDRDGDLDLVVGALAAYCGPDWFDIPCWDPPTTRIYENLIGNRQNWIQLTLEGGPMTNRAAIGARVEVTAGGVTQTQEIDGGHGRYTTQRDMTLHFGLGAECEAEVVVRWPDRALTEQRFAVGAGYGYRVRQGDPPETIRDR